MLVGASQDAFDHSMCWHPSFAFLERSASGRVDVPSKLSIQEAAMGERETGTLIGSDKVEGTAVFSIGDDHYPTPWSSLNYDTGLGGYVTNVTRDQLDKAPRYREDDDWAWNRANDQRVHDYYQASPFW